MTSAATTTAEALLLVETADGIATLTLNRPAQFNALSGALIDELQSALDRVAADPGVRVVVLAARGRGFCAGHDLKELRAMGGVAEVEALFARCSRMMMTLARLPQPVIAKVHGLATAAGCQLVATCDLAVASSAATFATPGVNIGAFCCHARAWRSAGRSAGSTPWRCCSPARPSAPSARDDIGLVNRVVAPEALDAEVESLAQADRVEVAGGHRHGQAGVLPAARAAARRGVRVRGHAIAVDFVGDDGKEGVDAFLAKRTPRWADRKY